MTLRRTTLTVLVLMTSLIALSPATASYQVYLGFEGTVNTIQDLTTGESETVSDPLNLNLNFYSQSLSFTTFSDVWGITTYGSPKVTTDYDYPTDGIGSDINPYRLGWWWDRQHTGSTTFHEWTEMTGNAERVVFRDNFETIWTPMGIPTTHKIDHAIYTPLSATGDGVLEQKTERDLLEYLDFRKQDESPFDFTIKTNSVTLDDYTAQYDGTIKLTSMSVLDWDGANQFAAEHAELTDAIAEIFAMLLSNGFYVPIFSFGVLTDAVNDLLGRGFDPEESVILSSACPVDIEIIDQYGNIWDKNSIADNYLYIESDLLGDGEIHDVVIFQGLGQNVKLNFIPEVGASEDAVFSILAGMLGTDLGIMKDLIIDKQIGTGFSMDFNTSNFAPVPEPATMLLLGAGLLGLAGLRRKIRK